MSNENHSGIGDSNSETWLAIDMAGAALTPKTISDIENAAHDTAQVVGLVNIVLRRVAIWHLNEQYIARQAAAKYKEDDHENA